MRATKKHLELYKREVLKWMAIFEIGGWETHFEFDEKSEELANIRLNLRGRICTFGLARNWDEKNPLTKENVKMSALHEALHLLFARVVGLAHKRYVSEEELMEAHEEAVNTLLSYILKKQRRGF